MKDILEISINEQGHFCLKVILCFRWHVQGPSRSFQKDKKFKMLNEFIETSSVDSKRRKALYQRLFFALRKLDVNNYLYSFKPNISNLSKVNLSNLTSQNNNNLLWRSKSKMINENLAIPSMTTREEKKSLVLEHIFWDKKLDARIVCISSIPTFPWFNLSILCLINQNINNLL